MKLEKLLEGVDSKIFGSRGIVIKNICDDSRKAAKGSLFVAIKGLTVDAHKFISDVIKAGVEVVVGEEKYQDLKVKPKTYIKVKDSRKALGIIASNWCGNPSKKIKIIGVTGTDGKTTTVNLIYQILKGRGLKAGMISTVGARFNGEYVDVGFHVSNPEPLRLHGILKLMVEKGCKYAVIEVTSHGIHQKRVAGIDFDMGVLTNITKEHLDYHGTFKNYQDTKISFIKRVKKCIVNRDTLGFSYIASKLKDKKLITYSTQEDAKYRASRVSIEKDRTKYWVNEKHCMSMPLLGHFNVSNALAAVSVARELNIEWGKILALMKKAKSPEGRLQKVRNNLGVSIYIDFAHTPWALRNILSFFKRQTKGKLIVVTGAEGERYKGKRPLMGEIATEIADVSIFTAVDPRNESVETINGEILEGVVRNSINASKISIPEIKRRKKHVFLAIDDRRDAIKKAIDIASKGDTVILCGKGHEKSMNYGEGEVYWSDQQIIELLLN